MIKYIRLLFLLFPFALTAQNWSPVNLSDQYNYRLDTDAVMTATIWQTGYTVAAGDTSFAISTTVCDSCLNWNAGPLSCDTCYGQQNVAQFTGRTILKNSAGWCSFSNPGNKLINLYAAVNDSWLFDVPGNVTATVIDASLSVVLGNADSVKTILLSTGDTIRFSKNYGITQWPDGYGQNSYYRLEGIHGRDLGVLLPRMKNYFDFNVGDMFEYHGHEDCGCVPQLKNFTRKYTINSKTISGDTLRYAVTGYYLSHETNVMNWNSWWVYAPINETLTFIDSAGHFGNQFNNELVDGSTRVYPNSGTWSSVAPFYSSAARMYRSQLFFDSLGNSGIYFGTTRDYMALWVDPASSVPLNPGSDTLVPQQSSSAYAVELVEGLGQVFGKWSSNFEGSWGERLTAYRKNGDTVGVFTPDNLLDGIAVQSPASSLVSVYPNPSAGNFTVIIPGEIPAEVLLTDLQGRTVKNFGKQTGTVSLSAEDLADGVYLLQVVLPGGMQTLRIVIGK